MTSRRLRLGVALLVPEPIAREVDALRAATGDRSLGRVPAHVTLVPPVNVHRRDLEDALALVREGAASAGPLRLELGPPATFLPDNPVLYLEVSGDLDQLESLRGSVFRGPLERRLSWPYVPHVTLCDEGPPERIEAAAMGLADYRADVVVDRVHVLVEEQRTWVPLTDVALGGSRVVGRGGVELEIVESARPDPETRAFVDDLWERLQADQGYRWDEQPLTLTARCDGRVVAVATGWTNEDVGHLGELVVEAGCRGTGIGARLLDAFEDSARRRGARTLSLRTRSGGGARGFYERRGWRVESSAAWIDGDVMLQMRREL